MATFNSTEWTPKFLKSEDPNRTRAIGFELELKETNFVKTDATSKTLPELFAGSGYDGGGLEFPTQPESIGILENGGSESFKEGIEYMNKHTKPIISGGTHINVSRLQSDCYSLHHNLMIFSMVWCEELAKIFGRTTNWARSPLTKSNYFMQNHKEGRLTTDSRTIISEYNNALYAVEGIKQCTYNKSTMIATKEEVYEFRGGKSTTDIEDLLAWGQLCWNITQLCNQIDISSTRFKDVIYGKYIENYVAKLKGERELNPETIKERTGSRPIVVTEDYSYTKILNEGKE